MSRFDLQVRIKIIDRNSKTEYVGDEEVMNWSPEYPGLDKDGRWRTQVGIALSRMIERVKELNQIGTADRS